DVAIVALAMQRVLERIAAVSVLHANDVQEQSEVRASRPGILNGNGAVDTVVLAGKNGGDAFSNEGRAVGVNVDGGLEVGNAPTARRRGHGDQGDEERQTDCPVNSSGAAQHG